jgi:hypothetical protein
MKSETKTTTTPAKTIIIPEKVEHHIVYRCDFCDFNSPRKADCSQHEKKEHLNAPKETMELGGLKWYKFTDEKMCLAWMRRTHPDASNTQVFGNFYKDTWYCFEVTEDQEYDSYDEDYITSTYIFAYSMYDKMTVTRDLIPKYAEAMSELQKKSRAACELVSILDGEINKNV